MSFVVDGDSIANGAFLATPSVQSFGAIIAASPWGLAQGSYYNYATNGAVMSSATGWTLPPGCISIYDRYMASVYPHRPTANGGDGGAVAWLLSEGGVNDLSYGRTATQLLTTKTAYNARAKADGFKVVEATIMSTTFQSLDTRVRAVNQAILAGSTGADFVLDHFQRLPDPSESASFLDGTHPTVTGHARLGAYDAEALTSGSSALWAGELAFTAHLNAANPLSGQLNNFLVPRLNRGSAFDAASGYFVSTDPKQRTMLFQFHALNQAAPVPQCKVEFRKNGQPIGNAAFEWADKGYGPVHLSAITTVEQNDSIGIWVTSGAILNSPTQTVFSGHAI